MFPIMNIEKNEEEREAKKRIRFDWKNEGEGGAKKINPGFNLIGKKEEEGGTKKRKKQDLI